MFERWNEGNTFSRRMKACRSVEQRSEPEFMRRNIKTAYGRVFRDLLPVPARDGGGNLAVALIRINEKNKWLLGQTKSFRGLSFSCSPYFHYLRYEMKGLSSMPSATFTRKASSFIESKLGPSNPHRASTNSRCRVHSASTKRSQVSMNACRTYAATGPATEAVEKLAKKRKLSHHIDFDKSLIEGNDSNDSFNLAELYDCLAPVDFPSLLWNDVEDTSDASEAANGIPYEVCSFQAKHSSSHLPFQAKCPLSPIPKDHTTQESHLSFCVLPANFPHLINSATSMSRCHRQRMKSKITYKAQQPLSE